MTRHIVCRQTDHLYVALLKLWVELGYGTQLGRADGGEVIRVGKEDRPGSALPRVEVNRAAVQSVKV